MATHEVVRLIRDLHRRQRFAEFDRDRAAFMADYDLTGDEVRGLQANDYKALYDMGCHPMSVLFFSQLNRVPMPEYLRTIGATPERVSEFGQLNRGPGR